MNKAPWKDFAGNEIHEGDVILHPSGERGSVVFVGTELDPSDQWRVDYGEIGLSRLCLQIGDKGQAVVMNKAKPAPDFGVIFRRAGFVQVTQPEKDITPPLEGEVLPPDTPQTRIIKAKHPFLADMEVTYGQEQQIDITPKK